eukprot:scaffold37425_cov206-Amphora_coffeaeformis.AAC.2
MGVVPAQTVCRYGFQQRERRGQEYIVGHGMLCWGIKTGCRIYALSTCHVRHIRRRQQPEQPTRQQTTTTNPQRFMGRHLLAVDCCLHRETTSKQSSNQNGSPGRRGGVVLRVRHDQQSHNNVSQLVQASEQDIP